MFKPEDIVAGLQVLNPYTDRKCVLAEQTFKAGYFILIDMVSWGCTIGALNADGTAEFFNDNGFVRYESTNT